MKKDTKNDQKGERGERNKNGTGRVGSLKTEENKTSEFKKTRHGLKHALACLKARWRIYIYIQLMESISIHFMWQCVSVGFHALDLGHDLAAST